jgi:hypothetical protein
MECHPPNAMDIGEEYWFLIFIKRWTITGFLECAFLSGRRPERRFHEMASQLKAASVAAAIRMIGKKLKAWPEVVATWNTK